jgi:tubulin-specific chaperone A
LQRLTGVALSIQKIIDINGKLSDAQSDVMKTTGMTKDEVDELTNHLVYFALLE